jgi:O-antigen/teichoic acid export membrane protein
MAAWFAGMLMVSGLDLAIVARFDYPATAYYAVAATLTGFVTQTQGAIFASLLPASAVLSARGDAQKLGAVLITSTRYGMIILLATALPLVIAARFVLRIWVGADYAAHSNAILQVLVVANVVRLAALPYATLLLGTNQQRKVIMSPLAEGISNLCASVLGAYFLGALGVAIGTLIGSFVGVGLHVFHNMPRTAAIAFRRSEFIKQGLLRPCACAAPFLPLLLLHLKVAAMSAGTATLFSLAGISGTGYLFWKYALIGSDKRQLEHICRLGRAAQGVANT